MSRIIYCEKHGECVWNEQVFKCGACGKIYKLSEVEQMDYGEECSCGKVLMAVPWAMHREYTLRPACKDCVAEYDGERGKPDVDVVSELDIVVQEKYIPSFEKCSRVVLSIIKRKTDTVLYEVEVDVSWYFFEKKEIEEKLSEIRKSYMTKGMYR